MWPNPQFTEEILHGKLPFLCSVLLLALKQFENTYNISILIPHCRHATLKNWTLSQKISGTNVRLDSLKDSEFEHGVITQTGITFKKIPCYMHGSACEWCIVENSKIFWSYINIWNPLRVRKEGSQLVYANKFSFIFQSYFLTETIKHI